MSCQNFLMTKAANLMHQLCVKAHCYFSFLTTYIHG